MHAWFFLCLICGQKFIKQLNDILHKEFDEIIIHQEQVTECPTCNELCTSVEYAGLQPMYNDTQAPFNEAHNEQDRFFGHQDVGDDAASDGLATDKGDEMDEF
jgi:hypothetical protein